jgi:hypothetical protein
MECVPRVVRQLSSYKQFIPISDLYGNFTRLQDWKKSELHKIAPVSSR